MIDIERSIDVENEVRKILKDHLTVYCRPLPSQYSLPNILVTQVGGSDANKVDTFEIVLDARASREAAALEYLRNAVGVLRHAAGSGPICHVSVNSSGSWGSDPVRPDLAMCSARISVVAHLEKTTIN
jgi:hypothetical protein